MISDVRLMNKGPSRWCYGVLLLLLASTQLAIAGKDTPIKTLPEVELMPKLDGEWAAERMTMNGIPASIRTISGSLSANEVIAYYEQTWRRDGKAVDKRREGEWQVIAADLGDHFVTLRVQPRAGGSIGAIVVSADPGRYIAKRETEFPLPRSVTMISHQSYLDAGVRAESITLRSPRSVNSERLAMQDELLRAGWATVMDRPASAVADGYLMEFNKTKQYAQIFLARDPAGSGQTLIMVTWRQE